MDDRHLVFAYLERIHRERDEMQAYAEASSEALRSVRDDLLRFMPAHVKRQQMIAVIDAALAKNPAPNFSAPVPTTTPCNEQCEPNGCTDCPLDEGRHAQGIAPPRLCHHGYDQNELCPICNEPEYREGNEGSRS